MAVGLLIVFLTGLVFSEEPPDVNCLVVNLDYVHCMWNGSATPGVNYTFYSRFENELGGSKECASYVLENTTIVGCDHPYENLISKRFQDFTTKLKTVNGSFEHIVTHKLQSKVKLNAPVNLSVEIGTDLNLWYYWNYSCESICKECEARHRINGKEWKTTPFLQRNSYCINLPSNSSRYELQVRGRIDAKCQQSDFWSDWSLPVFWGSMTDPGTNKPRHYFPTQTTIFSVVGTIIFFMLVIILVRHERIRVILIPVLPDPGKNLTKILADGNVEEWLPISKGIKEGFKANYNECACSVGEYSRVPQSPSGSSADQSSSDRSSSGSCASLAATD